MTTEEEELVSAHVAGDLDVEERQRAEALLAASDQARALARRLRALERLAPVEPDLTVQARVGDRLEVEATRRRRRRRLVGGAAVGLAAAAAGLLLGPRLRPPRPAPDEAVVRTAPGEYRLLQLGARAVAFVGEGAELEVRPGNPRLLVRRGSVRLVVQPSRTEPFVIASPAAEMAVLGTEFDVTVEDAVTSVRVARGEVEVRNARGRRRVWASETARVSPGESPRLIERLRAIVVEGPAEIERRPGPARPPSRR